MWGFNQSGHRLSEGLFSLLFNCFASLTRMKVLDKTLLITTDTRLSVVRVVYHTFMGIYFLFV